MSNSATTVRDLAAHAKVSISTVSRVLNRKSGIRPDSEARVLRAVEALDYQLPKRRPIGRGSRSKGRQTGNIGLFMVGQSEEWSQHPLFLRYLHGVTRACEEANQTQPSRAWHPITEFGNKQESVIRLVHDQKIDGLIIKGNPRHWLGMLPDDLPVVSLNAHDPALDIDQVRCDDHAAGYCVTQRLWEMGHRRIAFAIADAEHPMLILRLQGHEAFLRMRGAMDSKLTYITSGVPAGSPPMHALFDFSDAVDAWWSMPQEQRPSAIMAANDWSAAGLYRALADRDIRVPDEVSVVGFDNTIGLCDSLTPPLTSYETPLEQAASIAASKLIEKIEGGRRDQVSEVRMVRGRLIERRSVRPSATPASPGNRQSAVL